MKEAHPMRLFRFAYSRSTCRPFRHRPGARPQPHEATMTKPPKIPESVLVVIYTPELDVLVIKRAISPTSGNR
jgi:dATP pyrophosphohydrolase